MKALSFFVCFCWAIQLQALTQFKQYTFEDAKQEALFSEMVHSLRCVVCQNQSLADSYAPLAGDLKQVLYQKILEAHSKEDLLAFFVARYGEFVVYDPPLSWRTACLWGIPFCLLGLGLVYFRKSIQ